MKEQLIDFLKQQGADLIRFGNVERFNDPLIRELLPECRTVIGVLFRQLRGSRRGIEEGSTYYQYTTTAVEVLEENIIPRALLAVCSWLEHRGFEALPQRRHGTVREGGGTDPELDHSAIFRNRHTEPELDFVSTAVFCGLGEKGLSGSLLTPEFGPFVRGGFILTDAEFEPDPVLEQTLCDRCEACVSACPGKALSEDGVRDEWQCAAYYAGARRSKNPFMPPDALSDLSEREAILAGTAKLTPALARQVLDRLLFYPAAKHGYRSSVCGKACDTACYIHLEEKGVLTRKFNFPFRKRPEWQLSREDEK